MKKTLIAALICATGALHASAQESLKGTVFLGTSVGSTTYTQTSNDYTYPDGGTKNTTPHAYSFSLSPSAGVFVTNHLILGGSLGVSYSHNKTNTSITEGSPSSSTSTTNSTTVDLGPFLRYYFYEVKPLRTMLYMQIQGTVGVGGGSSSGAGESVTSSYVSNGTTSGIFTWTSGASLGVTHFIQKNIGIDFALGYSHSYEHSNVSGSTQTTKVNGTETTAPGDYKLRTSADGFTASVGFHWFIRGHSRG